jgi:hypothetical protein
MTHLTLQGTRLPLRKFGRRSTRQTPAACGTAIAFGHRSSSYYRRRGQLPPQGWIPSQSGKKRSEGQEALVPIPVPAMHRSIRDSAL